jgi:hypothetical protein
MGQVPACLLRQREVLVDRHFLGPPLQVEVAGEALLLQPLAQRVPQQLAALAEGHLHQLGQQLQSTGAKLSRGTMRTTALSTRGGGSNDSGGTNSTSSIA